MGLVARARLAHLWSRVSGSRILTDLLYYFIHFVSQTKPIHKSGVLVLYELEQNLWGASEVKEEGRVSVGGVGGGKSTESRRFVGLFLTLQAVLVA